MGVFAALSVSTATLLAAPDTGAPKYASVKPAAPLHVQMHPVKGSWTKCKVTWTPSEKDSKGNVLTPEKKAEITFSVKKGNTVLASGLKDTVVEVEVNLAKQTACNFSVQAVNSAGSASKYSVNSLYLGKPLEAPYLESFDYPKESILSQVFILGNNSRKVTNYITLNEEYYGAMTSTDPESGYLGITARKDIPAWITLPVTDLSGIAKPYLYVNIYREPIDRDINVDLLAVTDSSSRVLKTFNLRQLPTVGWNVVSTDISSLKNSTENLQLRFRYNEDLVYCFIDRIYVGEALSPDLAVADVNVRQMVEKGMPATVKATVFNYSQTASPAYTMELYRGTTKVATKQMEPLAASSTCNVELQDLIPVNGTDSLLTYTVKAVIPNDMTPDNNTSEERASIAVPSVMPPVRQGVSNSKQKVDITWDAPDLDRIPKERTTESFENYVPWTENLAPWINIDGDKAYTNGFKGLSDSVMPKNNYTAHVVFDRKSFPSDVCNYLYAVPGGGEKFLVAFTPIPPEKKWADDWLISPELNGCAQSIDFYELSYFCFNSPWEVLYSTTTTDTTSFKSIRVDQQAFPWHKYSYQLPEGAKYFAIRARINGTPPLQAFDMISYIPAGKGNATLKGYNVYHNGQLLTSTPLTACRYQSDGPEGVYDITAVYDRGESMPFSVLVKAGVETTNADALCRISAGQGSIIVEAPIGTVAQVYSLSGLKIADVIVGTGSATLNVQPGCYLVRAGRTNAKVVVK